MTFADNAMIGNGFSSLPRFFFSHSLISRVASYPSIARELEKKRMISQTIHVPFTGMNKSHKIKLYFLGSFKNNSIPSPPWAATSTLRPTLAKYFVKTFWFTKLSIYNKRIISLNIFLPYSFFFKKKPSTSKTLYPFPPTSASIRSNTSF